MRKRVRLLTDFSLSEVSIVDKAACDLADITSVQLVKRSDMQPELNPEALTAAGIKADEVGPIRKFFQFLFKADGKQDGENPSNENDVEKRDFSQAERDSAAESGAAMSDGSFPIKTPKDVENAVRLVGHSKDPAKAKAHIKARAQAIGATDKLPDDWKAAQSEDQGPATATGEEEEMDIDKVAERVVELLKADDAMNKAGARFSAETTKCLKMAKAAFGQAGEHFGKAADAAPDDKNIANGLMAHSAGMHHMSKIDFGGESVSGKEMQDTSSSAGADPSKGSEPADLAKLIGAEIAKALAPMQATVTATQAQVEAIGKTPLAPAFRIGGPQIANKAATDRALLNQAGAQGGDDLTVQPGDERTMTKVTGISQAFHKQFQMAQRSPVAVQGTPGTGGI